MAQARTSRRRGYWLIISLCASTGFFVNLYYLFEKFNQKPVLTNVLHDNNVFEYPDITFCLLNPIFYPPANTTRYAELEHYIKAFNTYLKDCKEGRIRPFVRMAITDYLFIQDKDVYSHPAWSAIPKCSFMRKKCNFSHFDVIRLWPYGNCFTLNTSRLGSSGKIHMKGLPSSTTRPDVRIQVFKAVNYPKHFRIDPHNSPWMAAGILVMIHEKGTFPEIGNSFLVDRFTQIELRVTRLVHLNIDDKCQENRKMYSYIDRVTRKVTEYYGTSSDCIHFYQQDLLARHCKCINYKHNPSPKHYHYPVCLPFNYTRDYMKRCINSLDKERKELESRSKSTCLKDFCKHPQFQTVISHASYPAVRQRNSYNGWLRQLMQIERRQIKFMGRSNIAEHFLLGWGKTHNLTLAEAYRDERQDLLDVDNVERNFMLLRIVPTSFFEDKVEEIAEYTLSRLLSDIGGCVGLWVGASLITLFEFIDLLLDCTDYRLGWDANRRRRQAKLANGGNKAGANKADSGGATTTANHTSAGTGGKMDAFDPGGTFLANSNFNTSLFEDSDPTVPDFITTV